MKQYRVFIKEGVGQVILKNNIGQIVGELNPDFPELIFNEIVFQSMGNVINGFTRAGWIGFELLANQGITGPIFDELNFGFPQEQEPTIKIIDPEETEVQTKIEAPPVLKVRPPKETNPITVAPDPGRIIVKSRKLNTDK
jgi:hypothetical protein